MVFQGNEGYASSVTHYYHFLFAALFPLLEYHLSKARDGDCYIICTDVGPMKALVHIFISYIEVSSHLAYSLLLFKLCELPLNILSLAGPQNSMSRRDAEEKARRLIALPAYGIFPCSHNISISLFMLN
jgi:hypothetical protein